jgi:hypothetical protein
LRRKAPAAEGLDLNAHEALRQIAEIRERMAGSQVFRGFRSLGVAFSGVLALVAATWQPRWIPVPTANLAHYLALWIGVAAASLLAAILCLWSWSRTTESGLVRERAVLATSQVLPPLIVGALLTLGIFRSAPDAAWMLPGLWSLVFSLTVFASRRFLSPQVAWVGVHYVVAGAACLFLSPRDAALAPWQMAFCFGGGQLLGAAILYWTVEQPDAERG